jgi:hypothetical protein
MGWENCGLDIVGHYLKTINEGRPIGYLFDAECDFPGCKEKIDRGLAYVCGDMHGGGEYGCGKYFCPRHLYYTKYGQLCKECIDKIERNLK